jgi:hypothetical protein
VLQLATALSSVAEPRGAGRAFAVLPVTLAYRRLRRPITGGHCHRYARCGDDELVPHLRAMLHDDGCVIGMVFGRDLHQTIAAELGLFEPRHRQARRCQYLQRQQISPLEQKKGGVNAPFSRSDLRVWAYASFYEQTLTSINICA